MFTHEDRVRGGRNRVAKQSPDERSATAKLGGIAKAQKVEAIRVQAAEMSSWFRLGHVDGDVNEYIRRAWTPRIPKAYEELLDAAMQDGQIDQALRVLVTMSAMTALNPLIKGEMKQITQQGVDKLRQEHDLSSIDTDTLRRVLGKVSTGGAQVVERTSTEARETPTNNSNPKSVVPEIEEEE